MTDMGQILRLTAETRDLERGEQRLDRVTAAAERADEASEQLGRSSGRMGSRYKRGSAEAVAGAQALLTEQRRLLDMQNRVTSSASGFGGIVGRSLVQLAAGITSVAAAQQAIVQARGFNAALAETSTLIEGTPEQLDKLEQSARHLARTYGGNATQQVSAFYQAISAGAGSVGEAATLLDTSNRLAIGGVTDITTAVDGLTTAVNAYGPGVISAGSASDAMFVAMKAGKTTIGELSGQLGQIVPIAAAAGVSFDEVVGGIAALTTQGQSTAIATTGLRQAIASIINPTKQASDMAQALGIEFDAASLKTEGLADFLQKTMDASGGSTEALTQLFGSVEALNAVLAFSGGAGETFNQILQQMEGKAGATDVAYQKLADSLDQRLTEVFARLSDHALSFGNVLLSAAVPALEGMANGIDFVAQNSDVLLPILAGLTASTIPAMISGLGALTGVFAGAATAATGLATAVWALTGPWGLLAGLVAAAGAALVKFGPQLDTAQVSMDEVQKAQDAANTQLAAFSSVYAPAAGKAAIDTANDYFQLAKAAREAAAAQLSAMSNESARIQEMIDNGHLRNLTVEEQAKMSARLHGAESRLTVAEQAYQRAMEARNQAATRVLRNTDAMTKTQTGLNHQINVSVGGLGKMGGGLKTSKKEMTESEKAAKEYADALENNVVSGITSMTDAWGDFVTRGFDDFSSFKDAVIGSFKNMLSQMISIAARNKILVSLGLGGSVNVGSSVAGGLLGGGSGGGGLLSGLLGNGGGGLLSGLLGGGGLLSGVGSGLAGVFSGGGLASSFANLGGLMSGVSSGLGAFGAALPAFGIIAGAVALLSKAFGRKHTASGIEGKLGPDGFDGRSYDFYKGGWLRSDKTKYKAAPESVQSMLDTAMGTFMGNLEQLVPTLGLSTKALDDFTGSYFKIDTHKRTPEQVLNVLNKEIEKATDKMAELVLGTDRYTRAGETSLAALTRLSTSLTGVNELSDLLGHRIWDISLASADAASNLVDLFGGLDAMTAATATYFQNFYTEEERIAATTRQLRKEFEKLGVTMPESRLGFRELVESLDTTTEKGRELYAGLLGLSGALSQVLPDVQNFTASMSGLLAGIGSEIRDQITIAQGMASDAKAASQLWYRTANIMRDFLSDLLNTDLTAASRAQSLNVNRNRFNIAAEMARGGDVEAARDIPELAKAYLQSVRETSATALDYRRVAASVQSQVQFLAGLSDLEGANDDVLTSLYEQQIDVLTSLGNFLNLEGLTDNQVGQLTAGVQELVKDWDGTMTMFDGALAGIEEAIKTTEAFSYGALVKELNVAVNAVAGADLPGGVAALVKAGGSDIQVMLDFVIRSDLAAPDKWLATNSLSEHVKTLNFVVGKKVSAPIKQLALLTTSDLRKNIKLFLRKDLDADTRTIALSGNSELSRVVNLALGSTDAEAMKLALGNVQDYAVTVEASLSGKLPKSIRKLVLEGSGSYAAMVEASLENLSGGARRILLRQQGRYVANIAATIASSVSSNKKKLLLNANTSAVRAVTIAGAFAADIPADQKKLLESEGTSVLRTIEMLVNPDGITPFGYLFLQQLAETGDVERTLAARIWPKNVTAVGSALLEQMAAGTGSVERTVSGRFKLEKLKGQSALALNQLAAGAGSVGRTITAKITARNLKPRAKDLLALMSGKQVQFARTVSGKFTAGTVEGTAKALFGLMSKGQAKFSRRVEGEFNLADLGGQAADVLSLMSGNRADFARRVSGKFTVGELKDRAKAMLNLMSGNRARFNRSVAADFALTELVGQAKDVLNLMSGRASKFVRTIEGRFSFDALEGQAKDLLALFSAGPGSVARRIDGRFIAGDLKARAKAMFQLMTGSTKNFSRGISGSVTVDKLKDREKAMFLLLSGNRTNFRRNVLGDLKVQGLKGQAADLLALMSGNRASFMRRIVGGVTVQSLKGQTKAMFDLLVAGTSKITKTIQGVVDVSGLDAGQRALLAAIDGSSAGSITLGGNIRFTPEQAFQNWYANTTQATITKPMDALRDMLGQLRDAVNADRIQRENVQKLAHAQTELSRAQSALEDRKAAAVDLIGKIEALEKQAGVRLVNGAKDATLQVNSAGLIDYQATGVSMGSWSNVHLWRKRFWGDGALEDKIGTTNSSIKKAGDWIKNLEAQIAALNPFSTGGSSPASSARVAVPPAPVPAYRSAPAGPAADAGLAKEVKALREEHSGLRDELGAANRRLIKYMKIVAELAEKADTIGAPPERAEL